MNFQDLMDYYGTVRQISRAADVSVPSVNRWRTTNNVPMPRQCQFELITGGKLKADVDEDLYKLNMNKGKK